MKSCGSVLTICDVCLVSKSQPEMFVRSEPTTPRPRCRRSLALFLSFVPGGVWRLDISCSLLCTVTGHCTARFAEIYNIVSNIFFQCFPHNIWSIGICCAQQMFSIRLLKWACIAECSGLCVIGSHQQTTDTNEWITLAWIYTFTYLSPSQNCLHNLEKEWWNVWMSLWPAYHERQPGAFPSALFNFNESLQPQSQTWHRDYKIAADAVLFTSQFQFCKSEGKTRWK